VLSANPLRAAAMVLAVLLLTAGCTGSLVSGSGSITRGPASSGDSGSPSSTTPPPPEQPANFFDCSQSINIKALGLPPGRAGKLGFECATISVPKDYSDPTGETLDLQLVRVHDSDDTNPIGSLLVNPGGPGGSGVNLALGLAGQVSDRLLQHFDLVGFDPRGVGYSSAIHCLTDAEKDRFNAASPDVSTAAGFAQAKRLAAEFAAKCKAKYGADLAEYNTVQTAKDMDLIRQAVGDAQMNYLGFSYGTELGAQYIHMFPGKVRVAVLDGAVDPLTGDIKSFADQLQGFEDSFDQFAAWCRTHSPCSQLGDPRQAVYEIAAQARRAPIPAAGDTRKATSALVYTGVLSALYSRSRWPTLGQALLDARGGNGKGLLSLADQYNERFNGHYTNIADANATINCNDSKPGPSDATIRATTKSWERRFPMFGLWSAASLFSCQQWQPDRTVPPLPTAPDTPRKVLVVGNLHDPATPYQGAKDLTHTLGNAELLTWNGEGHTSYLEGSSCIDNAVDSYLIDGTLPPVGTTCQR
jgi:pimeloyl-ACP methyl ester carboxylesterase